MREKSWQDKRYRQHGLTMSVALAAAHLMAAGTQDAQRKDEIHGPIKQ